ncbi:cadmium resistance transporter [Streptomyces griseorubiginosus]|uniref:Cadmium resistance transporter n=1 Tax=Streptomyces griseorubiginosus TaxID=67304 RepID=A0AAI8PKI9_9ACTN|nr:cadmium resistance transporter [Streptomyces griseorubiginosus]AYC35947.1 hypothetical protein DWG14_00155 [Streptomyces griseorubiginosus]
MNLGIVGQAAGLFAVTNIDDILIFSLFFAQGAGRHGSARRIAMGQYLGFAAILAVAIAAAFGATFLPESAVPYLGLLEVAAVTFANGGDNIGVYVPVFATAGVGGMSVYAIVFLVLVAVWCFGGRFFATRPIIAKALSRWGHILLPLVLIAFGLGGTWHSHAARSNSHAVQPLSRGGTQALSNPANRANLPARCRERGWPTYGRTHSARGGDPPARRPSRRGPTTDGVAVL